MVTRASLLDTYVAATRGRVIRPEDHYGGESPDLANHYLQFLTGRPELYIIGNAVDWAITTEEIHPSHKALAEVAEYSTARPGRHTAVVLPVAGDLMVFAGPTVYGALGIYLGHTRTTTTIYSQGSPHGLPAPATIATIPVSRANPLGWWHVRDSALVTRRPLPWAIHPIKETTP